MRSGSWVCLGAVVAGALFSSPALGQLTAAADTLFEKAVGHMKAGEFAAACPLLDESLRLDSRDGTLFTLANCRDREGKIATALGHYRKYLRAFGAMSGKTREKHADRAALAETRVKELAAEVPSLKLVWPSGMPPNTKILLDGVEFPAALDIVWELDPGEHRVEVSRAGAATETRTVTLERKKPTVEIDLTPKTPDPATKPIESTTTTTVQVDGPKQTTAASPDVLKPSPSSNVQRTAGFVALGLGGAGLVLGAVTGGLAFAQKSTVDSECKPISGGYDCSPTGRAAVDEIVKFGTPSTVGFVAGGVLAAAGVVLILTAPKAKTQSRTSLQVKAQGAPGLGFLKMEGFF